MLISSIPTGGLAATLTSPCLKQHFLSYLDVASILGKALVISVIVTVPSLSLGCRAEQCSSSFMLPPQAHLELYVDLGLHISLSPTDH